MKSETCSRCGEEVRWGVRHGRLAWWHREDVDHPPIFGNPVDLEVWKAARSRAQATTDEEREVEPIPPPEVTSTPIDIGDERLPQGAKNMLNLARRHGWEAWTTYSRGPRTHGSLGTLLGISDYVVLRARLAGTDRRAVASWIDGKFEFAWLARLDQDRYITTPAKSPELKAWIKREDEA